MNFEHITELKRKNEMNNPNFIKRKKKYHMEQKENFRVLTSTI